MDRCSVVAAAFAFIGFEFIVVVAVVIIVCHKKKNPIFDSFPLSPNEGVFVYSAYSSHALHGEHRASNTKKTSILSYSDSIKIYLPDTCFVLRALG